MITTTLERIMIYGFILLMVLIGVSVALLDGLLGLGLSVVGDRIGATSLAIFQPILSISFLLWLVFITKCHQLEIKEALVTQRPPAKKKISDQRCR